MSQKHKRIKKQNVPTTLRWRWIAVVAAVISIGGILLWLLNRNSVGADFTPEVTGAPSLTVSQETVDYGDVKLNTPIETVFRVRNVGDQALTFLREPNVEIVQGCWPPRAVVSSTTLRPGEEATVTLRFTMHEGMDGQHEFRVHLYTNDPAEPDKQLTVLSNWVP